jgi:hypothetical protein
MVNMLSWLLQPNKQEVMLRTLVAHAIKTEQEEERIVDELFPMLEKKWLGKKDTTCREGEESLQTIIPEPKMEGGEFPFQKMAIDVQRKLNIDPGKVLILWSGFEKGMLELAVRYAQQIDVCTVEFSELSNNFVKTCGSWDAQIACITKEIEEFTKQTYNQTSLLQMATTLRKQLWDAISRHWAQQKVQSCVAFIPQNPDFEKTLFQIELPNLQNNITLYFVLCNEDYTFNIHKMSSEDWQKRWSKCEHASDKLKTCLPELTESSEQLQTNDEFRGVKLFDFHF